MFENFESGKMQVDDIEINYVIGGNGPPLLLLHGYPQTHIMWHKVAPALSEHFTIVASDLRGYGHSSKPVTTETHEPYSKRAMGNDQLGLMKKLGFNQFLLAGHDRGGRVAHRIALDHPNHILKVAVMDIAPTYAMYKTTDFEFAKAYYHWFFLIQDFDLPERMIGSDPHYFLIEKLKQWGRSPDTFPDEVLEAYASCITPEMIHASCEDYRAGATIDIEIDQIDLDQNRKIQCPLLCIWGDMGFVGNKYDMIKEWKVWADDVTGFGLPCGHYLPEEAPQQTLQAMMDFFT